MATQHLVHWGLWGSVRHPEGRDFQTLAVSGSLSEVNHFRLLPNIFTKDSKPHIMEMIAY